MIGCRYGRRALMERWRVVRYREGNIEEIEDRLIAEVRVSLRVNGHEIAGLMVWPEALDKLAAGYLFNHGMVLSPEDIRSMDVADDNSWVSTIVTADPPYYPTELTVQPARIRHPVSELLTAMDILSRSSVLYRQTGGVHTSGLWLHGKFACLYDDIGRHNASDKVIGHGFLNHWPLPETAVLVSTGRISSDIVNKTIRARIPVLVSRSAPTEVAVKTADAYGLTLIGFTRRSQCNIYTHRQRINLT